jgi:hypothetical protein
LRLFEFECEPMNEKQPYKQVNIKIKNKKIYRSASHYYDEKNKNYPFLFYYESKHDFYKTGIKNMKTVIITDLSLYWLFGDFFFDNFNVVYDKELNSCCWTINRNEMNPLPILSFEFVFGSIL